MGDCVWTTGGPGSGKTQQAVELVVDALDRGVSPERILFVTMNPGAREDLLDRIGKRSSGWSGQLIQHSRMLLNTLRALIPPWERLTPLSEFQQRLWLRKMLEAHNPWGQDELRVSSESIVRELFPLIRQLKQGGVNFQLLRHRLARSVSTKSLKLLDFIQEYQNEALSQGHGDFVDEIDQALAYMDGNDGQKRVGTYDLMVIDDLHLAHRMQWRLLEPFLVNAKDVYIYSDVNGSFFRHWVDMGYRHRLRELGLNVTYRKLADSYRIRFPDDFNSTTLADSDSDKVGVYKASNALEEALWIAEQVDRLVAGSDGKVKFSDVVVVVPSETQVVAVSEAFRLYRVPHDVNTTGMTRHISDMVRWLQWLETPTLGGFKKVLDTIAASPDLDNEYLAHLYQRVSELDTGGDDVDDDGVGFIIGNVRSILADWRNGEYNLALKKLDGLLRQHKGHISHSNDNPGVQFFTDLLDEYRTYCRIVRTPFRMSDFITSLDAEIGSSQQVAMPSRLGDRVRIWSIPESRGKEACFVFFMGLNDGVIPLAYRLGNIVPREDREFWKHALSEMGTPCDLSELDDYEQHWKRELERFDLGVSRAKKRMYLSYVDNGDKDEVMMPTSFLELKATGDDSNGIRLARGRVPCITVSDMTQRVRYVPYIPSMEGTGFLLDSLINGGGNREMLYNAWKEVWGTKASVFADLIAGYDREAEFQLKEGFHLSHSRMRAYLECPRKFFYSSVLKIEGPSTVAMAVGNALHSMAQRIHGKGGTEICSDMDVLREVAHNSLIKYSDLFHGDADRDAWIQYVMGRIQDYLGWVEDAYTDTRGVEVEFDSEWADGIRFRGRIDRIGRVADGGWGIIDYKKSGDKKEAGLINAFRKETGKDFQFPIYYFSLKDDERCDISAFMQIVFDFKNDGHIEVIPIAIKQETGSKNVTVEELQVIRERILEKARDMLSSKKDYIKLPETQCRGYMGSDCAYVGFCTRADDSME